MKRIFIWVCVLCVVWVHGQLSKDDRCTIRNIPVQNDIFMKITNDAIICGYIGLTQILCCPRAKPADDPCTTQLGQPGKCAKITACIPVQNDILSGITNHAVCRYEGFTQIVCCPRAKPVVIKPTSTRSVSTRISARKCDEYSEFAFYKINISTILEVIEKKVTNCAFTSVPLIVGSTEAKIREFPHMALIGFQNDGYRIHWICGGTLISEQFVLSAAHCFDNRDYGPPKYVRLGEHDQTRIDDGHKLDLRIIQQIPHPEYQYPLAYNDIGLFKLEREVELNGAIRPACLPQVSDIPAGSVIASGWKNVNSIPSSKLEKVVVDMISQRECNSSYGINRKLSKGIVEEILFCSDFSCIDGPLQIYHKNHPCSYFIVGVKSFGAACMIGREEIPDVYTRVYAYLNWIENIVWPDQ